MPEVIYIVKKKFSYGDRVYTPGEVFEPHNGRWDEQILDSPLVSQKHVKDHARAKAKKEVVHDT